MTTTTIFTILAVLIFVIFLKISGSMANSRERKQKERKFDTAKKKADLIDDYLDKHYGDKK